MTEQFAALAAITQNPGKIRDDVLPNFCGKLLHHFLEMLLWEDFFHNWLSKSPLKNA
ncbi:hypothetical protein JHK86_001240 [Glycine max]|nr:hypothetical protein JHK86_001240 [Glycine max]